MTPTEQFPDVVYANRVFGAVQVRQKTRQLAAELGFPELILGPVPVPPPPPARVAEYLADEVHPWPVDLDERRMAAVELPDTHSHLTALVVA